MPTLPTAAVTGASGYVGSRIAAGLAPSFQVIGVGRKAAIPWSFTQPESIAPALAQNSVTTLIHSAWDFSHPRPAANWRTNVEGSRRLLDDALKAGVTRLIFISSISAFPSARSQYGKSKLAVEDPLPRARRHRHPPRSGLGGRPRRHSRRHVRLPPRSGRQILHHTHHRRRPLPPVPRPRRRPGRSHPAYRPQPRLRWPHPHARQPQTLAPPRPHSAPRRGKQSHPKAHSHPLAAHSHRPQSRGNPRPQA